MTRLARRRYLDRKIAERALARIDWATPQSAFVRTLAAREAMCLVADSTAEWLSVHEQERHPNAPPDWARNRLIRDGYYAFEGALRLWRGLVNAEKWLIDELSLSKVPDASS